MRAVDKLVATFEGAPLEAKSVVFDVHLKTHFWFYYEKRGKSRTSYRALLKLYCYSTFQLIPRETDFDCRPVKADTKLRDGNELNGQHSHFIKEVTAGRDSLRLDLDIIKETSTRKVSTIS